MKDLKKEYEELVKNKVPDLWDKIEATIDEIEKEDNDLDINPDATTEKVVSLDKKKSGVRTIKRYIPILVTAAVLFITCGAYFLMNDNMKSNETTVAFDSAPSEVYAEDECYAESEASAEREETASEETASYEESMSIKESTACEDSAAAEDGISYDEAMEESYNGVKAENVKETVTNSEKIVYTGIIREINNNQIMIIELDDQTAVRIYVSDKFLDKVNGYIDNSSLVEVTAKPILDVTLEQLPEDDNNVNYEAVSILEK